MPYIKKEDRKYLDKDKASNIPRTVGELNYYFTKVIKEYCGFGLTYQKINDILGVLEGTKLEFYRRVAIPYENKKKKENGDVY